MPPVPVHDSVNGLVAVSGPVDCEPDVDFAPDHAPDAVHDAAFVEVQVNVDALPLATVVGLACREIVGAGGGGELTTATVTDCVAVPPLPVHVSENALLELNAPVDCEPDVGLAPDHAPDAVHDAAFVEDQVNVAAPPLSTVAGLALSETVGAGGDPPETLTVTDRDSVPPLPVHVKVNVLVPDKDPVDSEPAADRGPDHAPDAVHDVAALDDQRSTEAAPTLTAGGSASSETAGGEVSPTHAAKPNDSSAAATPGSRPKARRAMNLPINSDSPLMARRRTLQTSRSICGQRPTSCRDYPTVRRSDQSRHAANPSDAARARRPAQVRSQTSSRRRHLAFGRIRPRRRRTIENLAPNTSPNARESSRGRRTPAEEPTIRVLLWAVLHYDPARLYPGPPARGGIRRCSSFLPGRRHHLLRTRAARVQRRCHGGARIAMIGQVDAARLPDLR